MFWRSVPLQLVFCIITVGLFGHVLPLSMVRFFYTISLFFIDTILFLLPLIIFSYLFNALIVLEKRGPILVIGLLMLIFVSNALAIFTAYGIGVNIIPHLAIHISLPKALSHITPYVYFPFKKCLRSDLIALSAFILGYFCVLLKPKIHKLKHLESAVAFLENLVSKSLKRFFMPFLPLYVLGFLLKMSADGTLAFLYTQYLPVFLLNISVSFCYVLILYKIVSVGFKPIKTLLTNMLPAGITGFSTMSGAVTMPVTIDCTEKNIKHPHLAHLVVPTASNMHMLGDDITITLTAMALVVASGGIIPSFIDFLPYVLGFCLAKFACVGIAGASFLVVLPVLKEHLGFSSEMVSLMTTLYILHDAFGTFHNVMGNGAFAIAVERIFKKLGIVKRGD